MWCQKNRERNLAISPTDNVIGMKVVISGAAGGIGSRLARRLNDLPGISLTLIDDLSGGSADNLGNSLRGSLFTAKVESLPASLVERVVDSDVVIHLAGTSSLPRCQEDHQAAYASNFQSTVALAEHARLSGSQFIFASTSAVYEGVSSPLLSEDLPVAPFLVYPVSKYISELHLEGLYKAYGFPSTALRFFNVFGENQDQSRKNPPLVNYIHRQLSNGEPVELFAPPNQSRDYVYVEDVLDAIQAAILHPAENFRVLNICSGRPLSMQDIVAAVSEGAQIPEVPLVQSVPDKIWDGFPALYEGPKPLSREIVSAEVLKQSIGSFDKAFNEIGWSPRSDVIRKIAAYAQTLRGGHGHNEPI